MTKPQRIENLEEFITKNPTVKVIDRYDNLKEDMGELKSWDIKEEIPDGVWYYFPWNNNLVKYLPEELHYELITYRNKNIISKDEQQKLRKAKIAVAGLSVGSHAAITISLMGMAKNIKIADSDHISLTNLNRLHYDTTHVGENKAEVLAQYLYQRNPFANIDVYEKGVTKDNMDSFLDGVDIAIDEMDNLVMKVFLREKSKKLNIPVIMATDNGNSVILDVERYDKEPNYPIFHGNIDISSEELEKIDRSKNPQEWNKIASSIIGVHLMEERLLKSIEKIGKELSGIPQLGGTAIFSGSLLSRAVYKIVMDEGLKSGKYMLSLDKAFEKNEIK